MIPTLSIAFMGISALISIGLPIVLFLVLRKGCGLKITPMLVGAGAFVLFAMILEQLLHSVVLRPQADGTFALLKASPLLYVLYGIFAAGIFEETARFLSFHLLKKKYKGIGVGLSYGIGHGGIEAILLAGTPMIMNIVISIMINAGAADLSANSLPSMRLNALIDTAPYLFLVSGLERIFAIVVHISLSLIVWVAANRKNKLWLFPTAIILHAIVNLSPALMQAGVIKSVILTEGIVAVSTFCVAMIAAFVCKNYNKRERLNPASRRYRDS